MTKVKRQEPELDYYETTDIIPHRTYYWIWAISKSRPVVLGPFDNEAEATSVGFSKMGGDFNIEQLPTRNVSRATQTIKYKILHRTANLEEAMQRASHKA